MVYIYIYILFFAKTYILNLSIVKKNDLLPNQPHWWIISYYINIYSMPTKNTPIYIISLKRKIDI